MKKIRIEEIPMATELLEETKIETLLSKNKRAKILGKSDFPQTLVDGTHHGFLQAIYFAYSDHRPFVISPESMWLLILQAFSAHINSNPKNFSRKHPTSRVQ